MRRRNAQERFETKTKKNANGCWLWEGAKLKNGYGMMWAEGKPIYAHRYSLEQKLGRKMIPGMDACHSCRNRHCVAPHHLREGTRKENNADKIRDGTLVMGEAAPNTYLIEEEVRAIRESDLPAKEVAQQMMIPISTVYRIRERRSWAWLK